MKAKFLLAGLLLLGGAVCRAQSPDATLFKVQADRMVSADVDPVRFETSGEIPLASTNPVYGLSVSGHVALKHETNSMVRITAECADGIEYLVYEANPLLEEEKEFDITDAAWETAVLQAEKLTKLNVTLLNATFTLQSVKYASSAPKNALARQNLQKAQENALIDRLNASLEKKGMLWRAGNTSVSELTYEQKKAMFGDSVPYLGGFEYYRGGIFVMPGYDPEAARKAKSAEDGKYVKEWDWRNRHGKNWVTPVKSQGFICGRCWAFAVTGTIESYINLYYNRLLNYDLSEQELVSFVPSSCSGGFPDSAFFYVMKNGIVLEDCFPYAGGELVDKTEICDRPKERIRISGIKNIDPSVHTIDDLKKELFRSPLCFGVKPWHHAMVLIGYKTLAIGDTIKFSNSNSLISAIVEDGSPWVGQTAWILKNSNLLNSNGYTYMLMNWEDAYYVYSITGDIISGIYTNDSIMATDEDEDAYYFWGISSHKPLLPYEASSFPDGDDGNNRGGPMDEYGNLKINSPIYISNVEYWGNAGMAYNNIFVNMGGALYLSGALSLDKDISIVVREGGKLIVDGGVIKNADIRVLKGGTFQLLNNGKVYLIKKGRLKMEKGAIGKLDAGSVKF